MSITKRYKTSIKIIKKSKILTKQQKKEYITKGIIEELLNSWKFFVKIPFVIIGITFCFIGIILSYLESIAEITEEIFKFIIEWIDNRKDFILIDKEIQNKLIEEIKENNKKVLTSKK